MRFLTFISKPRRLRSVGFNSLSWCVGLCSLNLSLFFNRGKIFLLSGSVFWLWGWWLIKLFIGVEHTRVSTSKEFKEFTPHIFLLIDVLNLNCGFRHKMFNKCIAIILPNAAQLSHHLISEEIRSFLSFVQFLGFRSQHEVMCKSLILEKIMFTANQLDHFTFETPCLNILLK